MAQHRKISAKRQKRATRLAVLAFLGLAVTTGHGVAAAETTDDGSTGTSAGSTNTSTNTGSNPGPKTDNDADTEHDTDSGKGDQDPDPGADTDSDDETAGTDPDEETAGTDPDDETNGIDNDGAGASQPGASAPEVDPNVTNSTPPEPDSSTPPVEEPAPPVEEPTPTVEPLVAESTEATESALSRSVAVQETVELEAMSIVTTTALTTTDTPAPTTAFPTNTGNPVLDFLHQLATSINQALPAYPEVEGATPTQVAGAVVVTLGQLLQATLANGTTPTPLSIPVYVLFVAAYQRFEQVATNHLPTLTEITTSELIPGTVTGKIIGADPDGDALVYTLADSGDDGFAVVLPDGTFTYTATSLDLIRNGGDAKFYANIDDTLGALDHPIAPEGHVTTVEVTVHIEGIWTGNIDPIVLPSTGIPDSAGIVKGQVIATDLDDDPLHFAVTGYDGAASVVRPNGAIVQIDEEGNWVYIPPREGGILGAIADSFTVYVSDGRGGATSTVVGIITKELDIDYSYTAEEGTATGGLSIPDGDVGLLVYNLGDGDGSAVTVADDGTFTYTGTEPATFTVVGTNAYGLQITVAEVSVTPIPPNHDPEVDLADAGIGDSAGIVHGNVDASDADGDELHYSVTGYGGAQSVVLSNGAIVQVDDEGNWTYIPPLHGGILGAIGDLFTIYVDDGRGGTASTPVAILTKELDIKYSKNASVGSVSGALSIPDGDAGLLEYSLGSGPGQGAVTVTPEGGYTYTGVGEANFTIVGTNAYGHQITVAEISVTPVAPNSAPQLVTTGLKTTPLAGKTDIWTGVTVKDVDGNSVTWSGSASNGTVTFSLPVDITDPISGDRTSTRTITYKSNGGSDSILGLRNGPADTITITVTDTEGASLTFTYSYP